MIPGIPLPLIDYTTVWEGADVITLPHHSFQTKYTKSV